MNARTATAASPIEKRCLAQLDTLLAYLDGELTPKTCRLIETHIRTCRCCGAMAAGIRTAIATCRSRGEQRVPLAVRRKARASARALLKRRQSRSR